LPRECIDIIGDTLVGIVDGLIEGEFVERPILEVLAEEVVREPTPPGDSEPVSNVVVEGIDWNGSDEHDAEDAHRVPKARSVPGRKSGCEFSGLLIEKDGELSPSQKKQNQKGEQAARCPLLTQKPIGFGDVPEATPEAPVEILRPFRFLRRHQ
jgi:hypothetical protein